MDNQSKFITEVIEAVLAGDAHKATKYVSDKLIVRATRKLYGGKPNKAKVEMMLTVGKPNFKEREFIKRCKKAGEPFEKIQLAYPAKKKR
ncbi:MAG: hypothetical protein WC477_07470 [Patescibacteria group bacterium]